MYILAFAVFLKPGAGHSIGQLNPAAYRNYAAAAAVVIVASILISSAGTHSAIARLKPPPPRRRVSPRVAFGEILGVLRNPSAAALLGAGTFGFVSAGISYALTPYFNTYFWGLPSNTIALLGAGSYLSAFGAMVTAPVLARRFGKKRAAVAVAMATLALVPLPYVLGLCGVLRAGDLPVLVPSLFACNVVTVGLSIIPPILLTSMMADVVEDDQLRSGRRSEGVLFAAAAFLLKCGSGLGLAGASLILSAARFPTGAAQGSASPDALRSLVLLYLGTLCALYAVYIVFITRYRITRERHRANLAALSARATAEPPGAATGASPVGGKPC